MSRRKEKKDVRKNLRTFKSWQENYQPQPPLPPPPLPLGRVGLGPNGSVNQEMGPGPLIEVAASAAVVSVRLSYICKPKEGWATHTTLTSSPGFQATLPEEELLPKLPVPPQPPRPPPPPLKLAVPELVSIVPATSR